MSGHAMSGTGATSAAMAAPEGGPDLSVHGPRDFTRLDQPRQHAFRRCPADCAGAVGCYAEAIRQQLGQRAAAVLDAITISIGHNGTITLVGVVPSFSDWSAVLDAVRAKAGGRAIEDELRVGQPR